MIEVNSDQVVEVSHYKPFDDSQEELLQTLYDLLVFIHREPLCSDYELLLQKDGTVTTIGRWESSRGYNFHKNMQYMENFREKKLPVFCQTFEQNEHRSVVAPLTALSLLNES